jgi:hypothetical protein
MGPWAEYPIFRSSGSGFLRFITLVSVSYVVGLGIEFMWPRSEVMKTDGYLVTGMIIP